eukprot:207676_1
MSASPRSKEKITKQWTFIFRIGCGYGSVFCAVLAFTFILAWLLSDTGGGFGHRHDYFVGEGIKYFNWHPLMMSLAFVLCMPLAIASFELYPCRRIVNKYIHFILNSCAVISATAGLVIIIDIHKYLHNPGALGQSVHGLCGYVTITILGISYFAGLFMYIFKLGGSLRGTLKPLHKRFGFYTMIFGLATVCMGIVSHTKDHEPAKNIITMQFAAILIGFVMFGFISNVTKFENKDPENSQDAGKIQSITEYHYTAPKTSYQ